MVIPTLSTVDTSRNIARGTYPVAMIQLDLHILVFGQMFDSHYLFLKLNNEVDLPATPKMFLLQNAREW